MSDDRRRSRHELPRTADLANGHPRPYVGAAWVARDMEIAGKLLLGMALILAILGVGALVLAKLGVERLPATLTWHSDNVTVFVPIGLMVVVSIVATILLNVFLRR